MRLRDCPRRWRICPIRGRVAVCGTGLEDEVLVTGTPNYPRSSQQPPLQLRSGAGQGVSRAFSILSFLYGGGFAFCGCFTLLSIAASVLTPNVAGAAIGFGGGSVAFALGLTGARISRNSVQGDQVDRQNLYRAGKMTVVATVVSLLAAAAAVTWAWIFRDVGPGSSMIPGGLGAGVAAVTAIMLSLLRAQTRRLR